MYFISCPISMALSLSDLFEQKTSFYASNLRSLLSVYGLMQDALNPSLKDVRLQSIIAAPSSIPTQCNKPCICYKERGRGWGGEVG
jgi:hypothetical protein